MCGAEAGWLVELDVSRLNLYLAKAHFQKGMSRKAGWMVESANLLKIFSREV